MIKRFFKKCGLLVKIKKQDVQENRYGLYAFVRDCIRQIYKNGNEDRNLLVLFFSNRFEVGYSRLVVRQKRTINEYVENLIVAFILLKKINNEPCYCEDRIAKNIAEKCCDVYSIFDFFSNVQNNREIKIDYSKYDRERSITDLLLFFLIEDVGFLPKEIKRIDSYFFDRFAYGAFLNLEKEVKAMRSNL